VQDDVEHFPDALPMVLAAQAYAKSELLWYFRHVGDKLPASPTTSAASRLTGQLLGQQPKQPQLAEDGQVVNLVAATTAVYDLLVSSEEGPCVICHEVVASSTKLRGTLLAAFAQQQQSGRN
jgi:hypothetical protein